MGYLFTTKNGVPIQTNSFNLALKKLMKDWKTQLQKNLLATSSVTLLLAV